MDFFEMTEKYNKSEPTPKPTPKPIPKPTPEPKPTK